MISETSVEMIPTIKEICPPSSTRARMSRPELSVPIGCVQENEPSAPRKGGIALSSKTSLGIES
jgi:hypothetical protein